MDMLYFQNQIKDEIDGGMDYLHKAIEVKPINEDWAKTLATMAEAEKDHAINLFSMMNSYYGELKKGYKKTPEYIDEMHTEITHYFREGVDCISSLEKVYSKA